MMEYLNKVLLKGRVGGEPAVRFLPSGDPVCNFSLATKTGDHVEWHRVVCYKSLAKSASETLKTGDVAFVVGEIRTREFLTAEDRALGKRARKVVELVASEAHLVTKKGSVFQEADETPASGAEEGSANDFETGALKSSGGFDGLPKYI